MRGGMRISVLVVLAVIAGGCGGGTEVIAGAEVGGGELVTCRKLGGEAVFVEYENGDGGTTATVVQGVPEPGDGGGGMELEVESKATKKAMRANGWSERAVNDLISLPDDNEMARNFGYEGTDEELDGRRRSVNALLETMPSCLVDARGAGASGE